MPGGQDQDDQAQGHHIVHDGGHLAHGHVGDLLVVCRRAHEEALLIHLPQALDGVRLVLFCHGDLEEGALIVILGHLLLVQDVQGRVPEVCHIVQPQHVQQAGQLLEGRLFLQGVLHTHPRQVQLQVGHLHGHSIQRLHAGGLPGQVFTQVVVDRDPLHGQHAGGAQQQGHKENQHPVADDCIGKSLHMPPPFSWVQDHYKKSGGRFHPPFLQFDVFKTGC